jgi:hypothetical protein
VRPILIVLTLLFALVPTLQPRLDAQLPATGDERYAGLQWRFVRIKYHYVTEGTRIQDDFNGEPWLIDGPAAEQNLSRRIKSATAIDVQDPTVLTLDDPRLFTYPWIYFVEPGNLKLTESDVKTLREFLLRGGTATFDDFHGPFEWEHFAGEMKKVFPDREIVEIPKDHPVFSVFYKIDGYPQIAGLGSFMAGRSWEKGGYVATCAEIATDASGKIRVVRAVTAFECGAVLNPDNLKNQIEGAVTQGLGGALFEAIEFDGGKIQNAAFSAYRVPRFSDTPLLETVLLDRKDLPSVGAGETPIVAIAPAIGNAIFQATGLRARSLPMAASGVKA